MAKRAARWVAKDKKPRDVFELEVRTSELVLTAIPADHGLSFLLWRWFLAVRFLPSGLPPLHFFFGDSECLADGVVGPFGFGVAGNGWGLAAASWPSVYAKIPLTSAKGSCPILGSKNLLQFLCRIGQ
jgi:hypothetical protein